jgi:ParB family transcriptional regulator, chromosome partitioning protein
MEATHMATFATDMNTIPDSKPSFLIGAGRPAEGKYKIPISMITELNTRLRRLNPKKVAELADSIKENGQINAITVCPVPPGATHKFGLVTGKHRLEACIGLGWAEIDANVVLLSDIDAKIWEIDENIVRSELSELEKGEHLLQRKMLYEQKYPETRRGVAGAVAKHADANLATAKVKSFVEDTAEKTGTSERSIQRAVQRAEAITPETKHAISEMPIADSGAELDALARLPPEDQSAAVREVQIGKAKSIRDSSPVKTQAERSVSKNKSRKSKSNTTIDEQQAVTQPAPGDLDDPEPPHTSVDDNYESGDGPNSGNTIHADGIGPEARTPDTLPAVETRSSKLAKAEDLVRNAKAIVEELKEDLGRRCGRTFEHHEDDSKFQSALAALVALDTSLRGLDWVIEFPESI